MGSLILPAAPPPQVHILDDCSGFCTRTAVIRSGTRCLRLEEYRACFSGFESRGLRPERLRATRLKSFSGNPLIWPQSQPSSSVCRMQPLRIISDLIVFVFVS